MADNLQQDEAELLALKANIGFGTAFKATLGFYAAQLVATIVGLFIFALVVALGLGVVYLLAK